MKSVLLFSVWLMGLGCVMCFPFPQQPIVVPPHLLRQYLDQKQQQQRPVRPEGTPIYEQESNSPPQYVQREQSQPQYIQQYVQPAAQPQYVQQAQPQYVPQARPQQYKRPKPKPQQVQQGLDDELPADYDPNPTYQFGFDVNDDEFTNYQNRQEERQGGVIKGSYSVVDSDGFIRTVTYTADPKEGFKAEVVRKPTDIVVKIPTPPPQQLEHQSRPVQYQLDNRQAARPQAQHQQQPQQYYRYQ